MAEVTNSVNIRVPISLHARLSLAAQRLDTTISELGREAIEARIEEFEERADRADAEARSPVNEARVEQEVRELIKRINEGGLVEIRPTEYKGAKGRAVLRMLALLWGDSSPPGWASEIPDPEPDAPPDETIRPKARPSKRR
jgi:predicted DNA-binding protein